MSQKDPDPMFGLAAFCAAGSTVGWGLYILGSATLPDLPPVGDSAARIAAWHEARGPHLVYGWGGVVGARLTVPYLFAMAWHMAAKRPRLWLAFLAVMSAALAPVYVVLPGLAGDPGPAADHVVALEIANAAVEPIWFIGGFLAYGLAPAWIAATALRLGAGPGWLNWAGLAGAAAGIVWSRPFLAVPAPLAVPGSVANIVLLSIGAVGLTLALWRVVA